VKIFRDGREQRLDEFRDWTLIDLLADRFPDIARPTLRWEVAHQIKLCDGDPLELLHLVSRDAEAAPWSAWNGRFPVDVFAGAAPTSQSIGFDVADAHLHSGASVPLRLFFDALASGRKPVDGAALTDKTIRTSGGREWDLHTLLAATRWALRLVRYLRAGGNLADVASLTESGFQHSVVERVLNGTFWQQVKHEALAAPKSGRLLLALMSREFQYDGLCSIGGMFWRVARSDEYDFAGRHGFVTGLIRACAGVASLVTSRPGEGLTRFVDRFEEMGLARDASLSDMKAELTRSTLVYMAASDDVVGAEFRKTIVAKGRNEFKQKLLEALASHNEGFSSFVDGNGRAMALSMPVGFRRQPCPAPGGHWTDLVQLRSAVEGYNALRLALIADDGSLTSAIGLMDVAGDEHGSASWPFAVVAGLLEREKIDLGYAIHAGESFYSELNGARRVGELFLADRRPQRIGHALALADGAAAAVCKGMIAAPIRVGDAICDLAWTVVSDCGDESVARDLLYDLAKGRGGRACDPDAWIDAYRSLFKIDDLMDRGVLHGDGAMEVREAEELETFGRAGDDGDKTFYALVCGAGADVAYADVKARVPDSLLPRLRSFGDATAAAARSRVLELVKSEKTAIESCPTSNVRLANLSDVRVHPMWEWAKSGVTVLVGSDDPLIFGATIADEFKEMLDVGGSAEVRKIAKATVEQCSGKRRRKLAEFQAVAKLADQQARAG
jgi:hypothetical protein